MLRKLSFWVVILMVVGLPGSGLAADYYFQLVERLVHVYWNEDGSMALQYLFVFQNSPSAGPIEYVDVSMPNGNFDLNTITASVNGHPITYISSSEYQGDGEGVALGLQSYAIQPGDSGKVTVNIGRITDVLYPDDEDSEYVSAVFGPAYFISSVVYGTTNSTVIYHLPPGVTPDEPRWHADKTGEPTKTALDQNNRVMYIWENPNAYADSLYLYGASFPAKYVPEDAIVRTPAFITWLSNIDFEGLIPLGCIGFFVFISGWGVWSDARRRQQYLPPKISMQGQGLKRGLTAVEAAILLEQPLDKVMTMILFAVVKKQAVRVKSRDPLELEFANPQPEGLHAYEIAFINAFRSQGDTRKRELQSMAVNLVKSVTNKMRGFSARETKEYYRSIIEKAWSQVEAADTPEVRSQKFDEVMEWTMLDRNYDDRTRDVFRNQPVFVPTWWRNYDPVFRSSGASRSAAPVSTGGGGKVSLPSLPGSDFAAGIINGVQSFSGGVIGSLSEFTSGVTQKTNPVPVSTSRGSSRSGGGGGSSCACACACAGCACACAGGGR